MTRSRKSIIHLMTISLILMGMLLTGCSGKAASSAKAGEPYAFMGGPVSKFKVKDYEGNILTNGIFEEHALTMVNFWSPNCKPCIEELPDINALAKAAKTKNVAVITVCVDGSREDIEALRQSYDMDYPVIALDQQSLMNECLKDFEFIPFTIFVDQDGHYLNKHLVGSQTKDIYLETIESLLKGR